MSGFRLRRVPQVESLMALILWWSSNINFLIGWHGSFNEGLSFNYHVGRQGSFNGGPSFNYPIWRQWSFNDSPTFNLLVRRQWSFNEGLTFNFLIGQRSFNDGPIFNYPCIGMILLGLKKDGLWIYDKQWVSTLNRVEVSRNRAWGHLKLRDRSPNWARSS